MVFWPLRRGGHLHRRVAHGGRHVNVRARVAARKNGQGALHPRLGGGGKRAGAAQAGVGGQLAAAAGGGRHRAVCIRELHVRPVGNGAGAAVGAGARRALKAQPRAAHAGLAVVAGHTVQVHPVHHVGGRKVRRHGGGRALGKAVGAFQHNARRRGLVAGLQNARAHKPQRGPLGVVAVVGQFKAHHQRFLAGVGKSVFCQPSRLAARRKGGGGGRRPAAGRSDLHFLGGPAAHVDLQRAGHARRARRGKGAGAALAGVKPEGRIARGGDRVCAVGIAEGKIRPVGRGRGAAGALKAQPVARHVRLAVVRTGGVDVHPVRHIAGRGVHRVCLAARGGVVHRPLRTHVRRGLRRRGGFLRGGGRGVCRSFFRGPAFRQRLPAPAGFGGLRRVRRFQGCGGLRGRGGGGFGPRRKGRGQAAQCQGQGQGQPGDAFQHTFDLLCINRGKIRPKTPGPRLFRAAGPGVHKNRCLFWQKLRRQALTPSRCPRPGP